LSLQFAAERTVSAAAIFDRSLSDIRALSHRHLVTDCALSTLFNVSRGQYSGQYSVSILPLVLAFHTIQHRRFVPIYYRSPSIVSVVRSKL